MRITPSFIELHEIETESNQYAITSHCNEESVPLDVMHIKKWTLLVKISSVMNVYPQDAKIPRDLLLEIYTMLFNTKNHERLKHMANFAACMIRPSLFTSKESIMIHDVIAAVFRADIKVIRYMLEKNPHFVMMRGRYADHEFTPLQAAHAVYAVDAAEIIQSYFLRLYSLHDAQKQIRALYAENLRHYAVLQEEKIMSLITSKQMGVNIDAELEIIRARRERYLRVIDSEAIADILFVNQQAQQENTFSFQPTFNAILEAKSEDIHDVIMLKNYSTRQMVFNREKSLSLLNGPEKLNRFREEVIAYTRSEIIFNPYHILEFLKYNKIKFDEYSDMQNRDYRLCGIVFSQGVGFMQQLSPYEWKKELMDGIGIASHALSNTTHYSRAIAFGFMDYEEKDLGYRCGAGWFGLTSGQHEAEIHISPHFAGYVNERYADLSDTCAQRFQEMPSNGSSPVVCRRGYEV